MKLIFKTILLITTLGFSYKSFAREVILLENLSGLQEAQMVIKIIQDKFKIPRKLITLKNVNNECKKESEAIMHLCLKKDGELEIVKVNKFAVENSLGTFLEMEMQ